MTFFQNHFTSLALPLSNPFQPKSHFLSKTHLFQDNLYSITSTYVFLTLFSSFLLGLCKFSLGFWKLGIFKKGVGVGVLNFVQIFFKILIGLSLIWCVCICVDAMWQIKHVLRKISSYSCIFHRCCVLLHVRCLIECPSDILVLNWTQVSPFAWVYSWLTMFNMFWSMNVCSTHFSQVVPQCHALHTLCIL